MPLIGEVELARLLGRHRTSIRKAVKDGRITQRPDGLFDQDAAVAEWTKNTHHEKGHNNHSAGSSASVNQTPAAGTTADQPTENNDRSTYVTARAKREFYEAKLRELKYQERAGTLTPAADVENARFTEFRTLREAVMQIPSRVAATLAVESDIMRCQNILDVEIRRVLEAYASGVAA